MMVRGGGDDGSSVVKGRLATHIVQVITQHSENSLCHSECFIMWVWAVQAYDSALKAHVDGPYQRQGMKLCTCRVPDSYQGSIIIVGLTRLG